MFMLMMMIIVMVVTIVMMMVAVVLGAVMRLLLHVKPQNSAKRRFTTGDTDDWRVVMNMCLDCGARTMKSCFIQYICLGQNDQICRADLIFKKFVNRAFMIKFFIGGALPLKGLKVMRDTATSQCRTVDKRDHPIKHHLRPDVGPAESLHKRLR